MKSLLSGVSKRQKAFKSQNEDIVSAHCINQHRYANIRILYIWQMVLYSALEVRHLEVQHFNFWFAFAHVLWIKHCLPCKAHRSIAKSSKKMLISYVIISHASASNILFMCTCANLYWTFKCLNGINKPLKCSNYKNFFNKW